MTNIIDFCKKDRSYFDNLILLIALFLIVNAVLQSGGLLSSLYGFILIAVNNGITELFQGRSLTFHLLTGYLNSIIGLCMIYSGIILIKRKLGAVKIAIVVIFAHLVLGATISFYNLYTGLTSFIFGNLIMYKAAYITAMGQTRQGLTSLISLVVYVVIIYIFRKLQKEGILDLSENNQ